MNDWSEPKRMAWPPPSAMSTSPDRGSPLLTRDIRSKQSAETFSVSSSSTHDSRMVSRTSRRYVTAPSTATTACCDAGEATAFDAKAVVIPVDRGDLNAPYMLQLLTGGRSSTPRSTSVSRHHRYCSSRAAT